MRKNPRSGVNVTRSVLAKRISKVFHWETEGNINRVVEQVFIEIAEALARGERVEIRGFGAFMSAEYKGRKFYSHLTKRDENTVSRRVVKFKSYIRKLPNYD